MGNNYRLMEPDNMMRLLQLYDTSFAYIADKDLTDRTRLYAYGKRESDVIKESLGKWKK